MRLITIAIHTYPYALNLKQTLADAGIEAILQNVNLEHPIVAPGVRVRIHEHDLANALRIIETMTPIAPDGAIFGRENMPGVLIPIDFSPHSEKACRMGMSIAHNNSSAAIFLHSYIIPSKLASTPLSSDLTFDISDNNADIALIDRDAEKRMHTFGRTLRERIEDGEMPDAIYELKLSEGVPEEAIIHEAKAMSPMIIVMGTRAAVKKEQELIGSVTAEVLDSVRFPVMSIPENSGITDTSSIKHVLFFAVPDQQDILAIDTMQRVLSLENGVDVTLMNIPSRRPSPSAADSLEQLERYCIEHYTGLRFTCLNVAADNIEESLEEFYNIHGIDLIVIPNRRRNIFSRLFNPTLAHRLLFRADLPMLAIPV